MSHGVKKGQPFAVLVHCETLVSEMMACLEYHEEELALKNVPVHMRD